MCLCSGQRSEEKKGGVDRSSTVIAKDPEGNKFNCYFCRVYFCFHFGNILDFCIFCGATVFIVTLLLFYYDASEAFRLIKLLELSIQVHSYRKSDLPIFIYVAAYCMFLT